jgi:uncharacterized membrane protein YfcA
MGGLLGVGGGLIFVLIIPPAARQLGIPVQFLVPVTIANSLACTFFTTFAAGLKRFLTDQRIRSAAMIIGISSTLISILVLRLVVNPGFLSAQVFDSFFIIVVSFLIIRLFFKWISVRKETESVPEKNNPLLCITGVFSGIVSPISGLGGGIVVVPVLHSFLNYPIRMAQSVSFGVIALSTFISSLYNLFEHSQIPENVMHYGLIVLPILLSIAPAAMLGALVGSWTSGKLSSKLAGGILLLFLLLILVRKILFILQ